MKKRITSQKIKESSPPKKLSSGEQEMLDLIKMDVRWRQIYQQIEQTIVNWDLVDTQTAGFLTRKLLFYLHKKLKPIED